MIAERFLAINARQAPSPATIDTPAVVVRLMVYQRLHDNATLETAIDELLRMAQERPERCRGSDPGLRVMAANSVFMADRNFGAFAFETSHGALHKNFGSEANFGQKALVQTANLAFMCKAPFGVFPTCFALF